MKFLILCLSMMMGSATLAAAPTAYDEVRESREIAVNISDALVPTRVDAYREDVKVQISGLFNNTCYSFNRVMTTQEKSTNTYVVQTMADVQSGHCLMVLVPFMKEVNLGTFERGEFTVRFMNGDNTFFEKKVVSE
ncbi:MAG: hypothetical protein AAF202_08110 [Pseudomonadota bacterium]